ncbi:ubiquitin-conjugating enzyme E2 2-like [Miscanthus floridulus]|uniref:ubiquitin-conjugating enzyme E2 2-like n=1 Tax=Miscanthus floridulus TaxID=154761 RepID=UPI00345A933D
MSYHHHCARRLIVILAPVGHQPAAARAPDPGPPRQVADVQRRRWSRSPPSSSPPPRPHRPPARLGRPYRCLRVRVRRAAPPCPHEETDWEGGYFPLTLHFSEDYPSKPPKCKFPQGFFLPNVYPSRIVCLSILNEDSGWRPAITVIQVFIGIQNLLDQPNPADPAQTDGYHLFIQDPTEYKRRVILQVKQYPTLFLLVRAPPASVAVPSAASVPWPRRRPPEHADCHGSPRELAGP